MRRFLLAAALVALSTPARAQDPLLAALRKVEVPDAGDAKPWTASLQKLREDVNRRDLEAWRAIRTKEDWERFRDAKIAALRKSLGHWPTPPEKVPVTTTKRITGDGFTIENLFYESRPGLLVTANLYVPEKPRLPAPVILIVHSHHNPKTQGELQDMGMTWARQGCLVLVPDLLGHGERRQHPFVSEKSFPEPFKVGRQDYYFRYNVGVQLHLVGESLTGCIVWDLMRGIDVLLARPGAAKDQVIVLGSVAGGGDPAAVLAALDPRVSVVAPFNFGGPQPETKYPLPDDAETSFNYVGGGSWESTRNLRLSARDGFLPWVIVGSVAPRRLIYAHEFSWDRERDPVWARLKKIYGFYGANENLAFAHGRGLLQGQPPEATHCNNIGPEHRKHIYAALERWFGIPAPAKEYQNRLPAAELRCLPADRGPGLVRELASEVAARRRGAAIQERAEAGREKSRQRLTQQWLDLLGVRLPARLEAKALGGGELAAEARWQTLLVTAPGEPEVQVRTLVLSPASPRKDGPCVIGIAHDGAAGFLTHRGQAVAGLLRSGVAVCLPELRRHGGHGRTSARTAISATEWMHGRTVLGTQLRELHAVALALKSRGHGRFGLWGDSFAPVNPDNTQGAPHDSARQPASAEPAGALLALLEGLVLEPSDVACVYARGGLADYGRVLQTPYIYVPHDALVPGVLGVTDLDDLPAALAPTRVYVDAPVDGLNRRVARTRFNTDEPLPSGQPLEGAVLAEWFTTRLAGRR